MTDARDATLVSLLRRIAQQAELVRWANGPNRGKYVLEPLDDEILLTFEEAELLRVVGGGDGDE